MTFEVGDKVVCIYNPNTSGVIKCKYEEYYLVEYLEENWSRFAFLDSSELRLSDCGLKSNGSCAHFLK